MTERDRGRNQDDEDSLEERPRVKVTDRRRVRIDDEPSAQAAEPDAGAAVPGSGPGPAEPGAGGPVSEAEPASEAAQLEKARREAAEYRDHLQRLAAEFDNYRKRVLKEQTRAVEMAVEPLVRRLLEVLDEFELALMAAERKPDFDRFLHGVELVYANLLDTLRSEGLERIDADGKPFDPEQHEALMQGGDGEGDPVVADVLRQGYRLKGRVIRPAGVKVVRR